MIDAAARQYIDPPLNWLGRWCVRHNIHANHVTIAGLFIGLLAVLTISLGYVWLGAALILLSRIADGLDGAIARASKPTDFGGYLDIVCDFAFYGAIPFGFILLDPQSNAVAGAFLILSFYVNGSSFLGYAILAEKHNLETKAQGIKTLYYSNGLLEGTETIVFFIVLCVFPMVFPVAAVIFGALCFLTAILRVIGAYHLFKMKDPS